MKRYIPDVKNNVCTVDANGITPLMECSCAKECEYICNRFNEGEEHDQLAINRSKPTRGGTGNNSKEPR